MALFESSNHFNLGARSNCIEEKQWWRNEGAGRASVSKQPNITRRNLCILVFEDSAIQRIHERLQTSTHGLQRSLSIKRATTRMLQQWTERRRSPRRLTQKSRPSPTGHEIMSQGLLRVFGTLRHATDRGMLWPWQAATDAQPTLQQGGIWKAVRKSRHRRTDRASVSYCWKGKFFCISINTQKPNHHHHPNHHQSSVGWTRPSAHRHSFPILNPESGAVHSCELKTHPSHLASSSPPHQI